MLRNRRLLPPIASLSAFDAVARTASFTAAAADLSLTQSAVSREVKSLEERLGVTLFSRTRHGVLLTPSGVLYADRVRYLLDALALATDELMVQGGNRKTLRLGILPTLGAKWLLPRMPDFFSRHPTIEVTFVNRDLGAFDFDRENLDVAICTHFSEWPGARLFKLADKETILVATPAVAASICEPSDLLSARLLGHSGQPEAWSEWFTHVELEISGKQRSITFETYQMVLQAAAVGLGVAVVPAIIVEQELAAGDLVCLFQPVVSSNKGICLAYPITKEDHAPVAAFRDWLLAVPQIRLSNWQARGSDRAASFPMQLKAAPA